MDKETLDIQHQIKLVGELVEHEAWAIVERYLKEKIEQVQNLSDIKIETPEQLFIELQARKHAVTLLAEWLHDIAGTAEVARQGLPVEKPSYIVTKDN